MFHFILVYLAHSKKQQQNKKQNKKNKQQTNKTTTTIFDILFSGASKTVY